MSKVAVICWSGTGNTENMANAVFSRLKENDIETDLFEVSGFDISTLANYDGFAFGCPAMGNEELEEAEFEPMFESVEDKLDNKPVAIFGSYEWNDGQWMLDWQERCNDDNINLVADGLAAYGNPEDDDIKACYNLADSLSSKL